MTTSKVLLNLCIFGLIVGECAFLSIFVKQIEIVIAAKYIQIHRVQNYDIEHIYWSINANYLQLSLFDLCLNKEIIHFNDYSDCYVILQ